MKFKNLILASVAAGSLAFSAAAAFADSIAYVNIQEIMHESTAAKSVKEQLESKQKSFQAEMTKKEDSLQKEDQELGKQRSVLAPDAFEKKVKDFKARATAAQKDAQSKRDELYHASSSSLGEIQKVVFDIVSKMAKDKGYTVVMPASDLLYADPKLDITKDVLAKLNSQLPKVTVKFEASATGSKDEE